MCNYGYLDDLYDHCDECRIYGDDYYVNEDGEWVDACEDCPMNPEYFDE